LHSKLEDSTGEWLFHTSIHCGNYGVMVSTTLCECVSKSSNLFSYLPSLAKLGIFYLAGFENRQRWRLDFHCGPSFAAAKVKLLDCKRVSFAFVFAFLLQRQKKRKRQKKSKGKVK
jgi:hypothetical protein